MKVAPYWKTVVQAVGGVVTVATAVLADDVLAVDEIGQLVAALVAAAATTYGVYKVKNKTEDGQR